MNKGFKAILFLMLGTILFCSKSSPQKNESPLLSKIKPANQYFHINPFEKNILKAEKGSVFTIEPDSFVLPDGFSNGDKIEIHLIEVTKSIEFAALPVSLEFKQNGQETLFESAGMFYINATYKDRPLILQKDKKIQVKFKTKVKGEKFFVYNYDHEKGWQKHGHNQEINEYSSLIAQAAKSEAGDSDGRVRGRRKPALAVAAPKAPARPLVGKVRTELYRIYQIDKLTWWNFDYPKPNLTCIKGEITGSASEEFSVTVFSKSEMGAYTLDLPRQFKISFYRNTIARIFVIDEKGNIAKTPYFETSDQIGHHKLPDSKCQDVGPLKIEKLPEDTIKNADKLRNYLQKAGDGT